MKYGLARFDYYFDQLQPILTTAAKQKNPALWLYRNNARTPLFMLEALSKMYAEFYNKKKFTKIKEHFKLLEDGLGAIDYYDMTSTHLAKNDTIPIAIINYLQAQTREKIQSLNEILIEKDWLLKSKNRISKIKKKLGEATFVNEELEVNLVKEFYKETIESITTFAKDINYTFNNMETEVHELRRKLRWLSIYPQALRGAIQLEKSENLQPHLNKYCTTPIVTSPFNKMPQSADLKYFLLLHENNFYALSWMIEELGNLKDNGLHTIAVKEALQQISSITDEAAFKKTYQILGKQQTKISQLLTDAGKICKTFFEEHNLESLVIGTTHTH